MLTCALIAHIKQSKKSNLENTIIEQLLKSWMHTFFDMCISIMSWGYKLTFVIFNKFSLQGILFEILLHIKFRYL